MIKKITPNIHSIEFKEFGSIVYLVQIQKQNILIDTSSKENSSQLISSLKELNLKPEDITTIILTHAHYDHIENIHLFPNAKIYSNKNINEFPLKEFNFYKTPGHTQEDIIILYNNVLFSGDVIFHEGYIGRTDFPESSPEKMQKSLEFIKTLKFEILCPGH